MGVVQSNRRGSGERPAQPEQYDPRDYNVADALDYAAEHPDEIGAIRAAEEAGKARVTLLAGLDDIEANANTDDG